MSKISTLASLLALPMLLSSMDTPQQEQLHKKGYTEEAFRESLDQSKHPPSGTKEYFFNNDGEFLTENIKKEDAPWWL